VVDPDDDTPLESRPPTLADVVSLCRRLNEEGARYVVVGGIPFAKPELLWRMKETTREKDRLDRMFLARLLDRND
jgi:hypothetical protein